MNKTLFPFSYEQIKDPRRKPVISIHKALLERLSRCHNIEAAC